MMNINHIKQTTFRSCFTRLFYRILYNIRVYLIRFYLNISLKLSYLPDSTQIEYYNMLLSLLSIKNRELNFGIYFLFLWIWDFRYEFTYKQQWCELPGTRRAFTYFIKCWVLKSLYIIIFMHIIYNTLDGSDFPPHIKTSLRHCLQVLTPAVLWLVSKK